MACKSYISSSFFLFVCAVLITSAEKSIGRQAVLKHISELRSFFVETAENDPNFMQSVINSRRAMRDEPTNGPRGSVMDE